MIAGTNIVMLGHRNGDFSLGQMLEGPTCVNPLKHKHKYKSIFYEKYEHTGRLDT
jgi:hypothetical protein